MSYRQLAGEEPGDGARVKVLFRPAKGEERTEGTGKIVSADGSHAYVQLSGNREVRVSRRDLAASGSDEAGVRGPVAGVLSSKGGGGWKTHSNRQLDPLVDPATEPAEGSRILVRVGGQVLQGEKIGGDGKHSYVQLPSGAIAFALRRELSGLKPGPDGTFGPVEGEVRRCPW